MRPHVPSDDILLYDHKPLHMILHQAKWTNSSCSETSFLQWRVNGSVLRAVAKSFLKQNDLQNLSKTVVHKPMSNNISCCVWAFLIVSGIVWDNQQQQLIQKHAYIFELNISWCTTISIKIFYLFVDLPQIQGPHQRSTWMKQSTQIVSHESWHITE